MQADEGSSRVALHRDSIGSLTLRHLGNRLTSRAIKFSMQLSVPPIEQELWRETVAKSLFVSVVNFTGCIGYGSRQLESIRWVRNWITNQELELGTDGACLHLAMLHLPYILFSFGSVMTRAPGPHSKFPGNRKQWLPVR